MRRAFVVLLSSVPVHFIFGVRLSFFDFFFFLLFDIENVEEKILLSLLLLQDPPLIVGVTFSNSGVYPNTPL